MLRLHDFVPISHSNGPGVRSVVWLQGCTLACPGCFNPGSHTAESGRLISTDDLYEMLSEHLAEIEGITISGGEPFQQAPELKSFLRLVRSRASGLSVVMFSGYNIDEINAKVPESAEILRYIDVLIAGRYVENLRVAQGLIGSSNKKMHFLTNRYGVGDFDELPEAEVIITADGQVVLTGIDPLRLEQV